MTFLTCEQIVQDIIEYMQPQFKQTLVRTAQTELIGYHDSWGRQIRNDYYLWDPDNPLTMKNYQPQLVDGVDVNPRHPDEVSMSIIEQVWTRLRHLHMKNALYPNGVPTTLDDSPQVSDLYKKATKTGTLIGESNSLHLWSKMYIIDNITHQFIGALGCTKPYSVDIYPKQE